LAGEAMLAIAGAQALRPGEPATQAIRQGALHQVARGVPRKGEKNPVVGTPKIPNGVRRRCPLRGSRLAVLHWSPPDHPTTRLARLTRLRTGG